MVDRVPCEMIQRLGTTVPGYVKKPNDFIYLATNYFFGGLVQVTGN